MLLAMALVLGQADGKPPQPLLGGTWMTNDDYPKEEARLGHAGTVGFELQIDASGRPSGCSVTQSTGYPGLDSATCDIVRRRLRFKPARDPHGKATTGTFKGRFTWQRPGKSPAKAGAMAEPSAALAEKPCALELTVAALPGDYRQPAEAVVLLDAEHQVTDCRISQSSGSAAADRVACAQLRALAVDPVSNKSAGSAAKEMYIVSFRTDAPAKH